MRIDALEVHVAHGIVAAQLRHDGEAARLIASGGQVNKLDIRMLRKAAVVRVAQHVMVRLLAVEALIGGIALGKERRWQEVIREERKAVVMAERLLHALRCGAGVRHIKALSLVPDIFLGVSAAIGRNRRRLHSGLCVHGRHRPRLKSLLLTAAAQQRRGKHEHGKQQRDLISHGAPPDQGV